MSQQDYTGIKERSWTEQKEISLEDGETALVARADGTLWLHMPGEMDDEASQPMQLMVLASLMLSGTPMAKSVFDQVVSLREQNLELASTSEELPN